MFSVSERVASALPRTLTSHLSGLVGESVNGVMEVLAESYPDAASSVQRDLQIAFLTMLAVECEKRVAHMESEAANE
jgi:hypothetical protein